MKLKITGLEEIKTEGYHRVEVLDKIVFVWNHKTHKLEFRHELKENEELLIKI